MIIAENEASGIDVYKNDKIIKSFTKQPLTDQIIEILASHLEHENEPISIKEGFEDNYYILHKVFKEYLIDIFLCVFYGYYSDDEESYLRSLRITFQMFKSLHNTYYDLIRYEWHFQTFTAPPNELLTFRPKVELGTVNRTS